MAASLLRAQCLAPAHRACVQDAPKLFPMPSIIRGSMLQQRQPTVTTRAVGVHIASNPAVEICRDSTLVLQCRSSQTFGGTVLRCTGSDIDALESPSVELDSRGRSHDQADQSLTASADDPKCPTAPNWPQALPQDIREPLVKHPHRADLLEVVLDLGRRPEARFLGKPGGEYLREAEITAEDLAIAEATVGSFGSDNRAGITSTLHRISCIRNRKGDIIGLTCRVGRAVTGHTDMIRDLVESGHSVLLLGRPGVGKTTVIRELARVLADELRRRVVIVDTSNEIGGDGDVPHPAIGMARRMQVPDADKQHMVMIEAVENHMPEVVIVDEIGTEAEALACRTIAERGVVLIGTAHGRFLENLIKNPTLSDLVGGIQSVTLGDEEAHKRGTQKTILERKAPPTFPIVVEIRERSLYVAHWVEDSVDAMLQGRQPSVQVRERDTGSHGFRVREVSYAETLEAEAQGNLSRGSYDDDYEAALQTKRTAVAAAKQQAQAARAATQAANNIVSSMGLAVNHQTGSTGGSLSSGSLDEQDAQEGQSLGRMLAARRPGVLAGTKLPGLSGGYGGSMGLGMGAGRGGAGGNGGGKGGGKGGRTKGRAYK